MMEIIRQFTITSEVDILSLDIIDFNRLNGAWNNSGEAMKTILSWFRHSAIATEIIVPNFFDAPKRDDFPAWEHAGNHVGVAKSYWDWFFWNHENGKLSFLDSPDFYGAFEDGHRFFGDIGRVSASAFAMSQKLMGDHDLWISLKGNGKNQILIETTVDIKRIFNQVHGLPYKGRARAQLEMVF